MARRYGVSTETVRNWRKRGTSDCYDRSNGPHKLLWKATDEERAIVCALRRTTGLPLDDLTFVVTHVLLYQAAMIRTHWPSRGDRWT